MIAPSTGGALAAADLDGDDDPDLVAGGLWYENLGSGASWLAHPNGLVSADRAVDLDGDGDVDVLGTGLGSGVLYPFSWGENATGNGASMVAHAIAELAAGSLALGSAAADADGDGDLDALVLDSAGQLAWHENTQGTASVWLAHALTALGSLQSLDVGDIDGDGDVDVLTGGASDFSWHENALGDGSSWVPHSIHRASSYHQRSVRATDVDGDGALDALFSTHEGSAAGLYRMGWLRNVGGGSSWVLNVVRAEASAPPSRVPTVIGADLDRDGDTDLVELLGQQTVWYEQAAGAWSRHVPPGLAWNVEAVLDVDLDGDRDLVGRSGDIHWRENLTTVSPYGSDVNPPRSLTLVAGTAAIGQTFTFGLDNPLGTQTSGTRTLLNIATAPDEEFPGGDLLPSWGMAGRGAAGELLLSYSHGNPVAHLAGPDWAGPGTLALIPVAVPADPRLIGLTVYLQGVLVDPSASLGVKFGLTNALRIELGP
ncbi:MAG: VCBS repeat-containing protein [Planctomycetes bacterium]|nr:VCBS repeat-containing protein [Planctomycetota bacterium]